MLVDVIGGVGRDEVEDFEVERLEERETSAGGGVRVWGGVWSPGRLRRKRCRPPVLRRSFGTTLGR